jgi:hypothetical protein
MEATTSTTQRRKAIPELTAIHLWTVAGGRCQFCNEYLLQDSLTLKGANFSNVAHIVAISRDGPRGDDPLPLAERDKIGNLMLVCRKHHALIDSREHVAEYTVEKLREMKRRQEERILRLTGFDPANKTTILRLRANFDSQVVDPIARAAIERAIEPKFMQDEQGIPIDLTQIPFRLSDDYWALAGEEVRNGVRAMFAPALARDPVRHISVFAMAPIPLLVLLGHCLGSLFPIDLYQRHMDTDSWCWKDGGEPTLFKVAGERNSTISKEVAVLISVSGAIDRKALPPEVASLPVYELTVAEGSPHRTRINSREDLERFRIAYQDLLGRIRDHHPGAEAIRLFAAVPTPVAIICGREVLRKVDPTIHVYDFDKVASRYKSTLKVNEK